MDGNSIFKRRCIDVFLKKKIECSKLENILRAGMQASSTKGSQPWEFIVIENNKKLEEISTYSFDFKGVKDAPMAILACANLSKVVKDELWWQQDLSSSIQNMLIQTVEEGLGSKKIGFHFIKNKTQEIRKLFKLPENIVPFTLIILGYSEEKNYFEDRYDGNKVHFEKFIRE